MNERETVAKFINLGNNTNMTYTATNGTTVEENEIARLQLIA
jgi:hypothetical protein